MRTCPSDRAHHAWRGRSVMRALLGTAMIVAIAGCGGVLRNYPGVSREALWRAALGTAERPTGYSDWHVVENGVYADEPAGRIEIYRELKRDYTPVGQKRRRQQETWALTIQLETEEGQIPSIRVRQNSTIRSPRFTLEADRFFDEVGLRLAQASPQGIRGVPRRVGEPAAGVPEAGAEALATPEAREAVRGGGAPTAGGPPRQSPEPGASMADPADQPSPVAPAGPARPAPVPAAAKTVPERPQD